MGNNSPRGDRNKLFYDSQKLLVLVLPDKVASWTLILNFLICAIKKPLDGSLVPLNCGKGTVERRWKISVNMQLVICSFAKFLLVMFGK